MFRKKRCENCREKISDKFEFCPYCGKRANEEYEKENWGMLGKNDFADEFGMFSNSLFGNAGFGVLNKMLGSAVKMLEKEMQKEMNQQNKDVKRGFELFINGKRINPENIKITKRQIPVLAKEQTKQIENKELKTFDKEQQKKFAKLPREEPKTNIRRLSNRIIYEIEVPGVKTIEDVSVLKLENSIEIKAISNEKAYSKIIQINLPIIDYKINKEKLILELTGD